MHGLPSVNFRDTGLVTASVAVGDLKQFEAGAQFGAWIGRTPRQHYGTGKNTLGGVAKSGETCQRSLLIQGVKSRLWRA